MDSIYSWIQNNIGFVFLVYGLSFVVMGVAILVQPRKGSRFKLSNILWLLVAYAIIHAPADFMDMWNAMKGRNEILFQTGQILTYISYCFLFEFGRRLIGLYKKIIGWWLLPIVMSAIFTVSVFSGNFWVYANVLIGYFVRFPAGLMSGIGFFTYYSRGRKYFEQMNVKKYFYLTGASLLAWSFFCGIVRAKANFCPINTEAFFHTVKMPVHFFRMICALIATYGTVGILRIFHWETTTAIQSALEMREKITEGLDEGILLIDRNFKILWANRKQKEQFGQIVGEYYYRATHRRDTPCRPPHDICPIVEVLKTGKPATETHTRFDRQGNEVFVEVTAYPVRNETGEITQFIHVSRDITERKQMEEALRESQDRYRALVENTILGITVIDTNHKIIMANTMLAKLFNKPASDFVGKNCFREYEKREAVCPHCPGVRAMASGKTVEVETQGVRDDGSRFYVRNRAIPFFGQDGVVKGFIELIEDIDARKKLEEDLRSAKAQAEAANEAKSEFLANMSHEIRTPLNAIIGFSEILACEGLSDEQTEWVRTIRDSGEHLLELINDILDFSKIEAGKLDLEMIACSLENLCAKVESLMRPAAMKKGLEFGFRENGVLPARIRTDPMHLSQCLLNLVGNAVKFTEQGHVYIDVRQEATNDEPCIRFDVEDTGIGIPLEKQQLIFESFTQADGSTTRRFGGSGLGLAITKRLAELLGGRVSLTSEEGKGSVFSLVVPVGVGLTEQAPLDGRELADELSVVQSISAAPDAEFKFTGRALVAEDAVTNQMLIKLMLERMGLEVTMVKDGAEAVREGLAQSYDLIFMDIQMPNMSGYEAAGRLRKKGLTTPIIALTANAMEGDDKKCIEAGCDDYLPKPIERAKLMEIARKYLTPQPQDLSEKIDSVKSTVDDLRRLCSEDVEQQDDSSSAGSAGEVIDWAQLISRVVEEDIAREIVPLCVEDNRQRLEMLAAAVQAGNARDVKLYAHAIKGSAANTGATQLSQAAYRLEYMAHRDDLSQAEQLLQEIRAEFGRFESFVSNPDWVEAAKGRQASKQPR